MKRNTVIIFGAFSALLIIIGMVAVPNMKESSDVASPAPTQSSQSSNMNQATAAPNTVQIRDFAFGPEKITIKKGTTVTWTNQDDAHHDISPTSGASDFTASKLLAKGESYSFSFNQVGTYTYKCSPHPYMKASVEVTE